MSGLDNLMVVATLMLSIGFGFVVEGTFPPEKAEELGHWKCETLGIDISPLTVYSFLCALSLCFPFWCLIFTIRMRYEVELIIHGHMSELRKQLGNVLKKRKMIDPDSEVSQEIPGVDPEKEISRPLAPVSKVSFKATVAAKLLPAWFLDAMRRKFRKCPSRIQSVRKPLENAEDKFAQNMGAFSIPDEPSSIEQTQIIQWAQKDLLYRMKYYHFYLVLAHLFLWLGMLCAIFTCAILLGVYMMENFPNTPRMWKVYAYPVAASGALGVVYAAWIWLKGYTPATMTTLNAADCLPDGCGAFMRGAGTRPASSFREQSDPLAQPLLGRSSTSIHTHISMDNEPGLRREGSLRLPIESAQLPKASPSLWKNSGASPLCSNARVRAASNQTDDEPPIVYELRVRDSSSGHDAFRRVCFTKPPWSMPLRHIRAKIVSKFEGNTEEPVVSSGLGGRLVRQISGGATPFSREVSHEDCRSVEYLVRLSDRLEICDDEDVAELRNGDRLEVTFSTAATRRAISAAPTPAIRRQASPTPAATPAVRRQASPAATRSAPVIRWP
eukprot:TRINITY_DN27196_c0_g2_i1.p1 TRINITY_DN27196_c0_g2~~TRINITY_DN27196_c0_g2_i1.p1  ORF type:complete len:633 (+),score=59.15 TRINITY_DN27196_c0_g2_i1:235-1899(+)